MKIQYILSVCVSVLFLSTAGCGISGAGKAADSVGDSFSQVSEVAVVPSSSEALGGNSEVVSGKGELDSKTDTEESASPVTQINSEESEDDNGWVVYVTNEDTYKLHIKRADGTEDRVILDDIALAPCVAGEWVYYINPLIEIDKVKLDGSQKTKVCDIPDIMEINGNAEVTAKYKDGSILYRTVQLHEVGNNSSYSPHYYKLNPETNTMTEIKGW